MKDGFLWKLLAAEAIILATVCDPRDGLPRFLGVIVQLSGPKVALRINVNRDVDRGSSRPPVLQVVFDDAAVQASAKHSTGGVALRLRLP